MKLDKIRGVAVAVATASVLAGTADSVSAQPMKPTAIKQFAFVRAAGYNDKNDMRPTRLLLTRNKLLMKGRCNPRNPRNPFFKVWENYPGRTVSVSCAGRRVSGRQPEPIFGIYEKTIPKIGNKVAATANVSNNEHGTTTLLWVNNRKAVLKFAEPETGSVVSPVKSIVFLNQGRPKVRRYE